MPDSIFGIQKYNLFKNLPQQKVAEKIYFLKKIKFHF